MKKLLIILCTLFWVVTYVHAESVVYVFAGLLANSDAQISVDGEILCDLNGPIKKTMNNDMFQMPYRVAYPCYRKLIFNREGTIIISVKSDFTNSMNLTHTVTKGEFQLDLEDGQTYYLEFKGRGLKDNQLLSLPEKKANKYLSDKKWKELPPFIVNQ